MTPSQSISPLPATNAAVIASATMAISYSVCKGVVVSQGPIMVRVCCYACAYARWIGLSLGVWLSRLGLLALIATSQADDSMVF